MGMIKYLDLNNLMKGRYIRQLWVISIHWLQHLVAIVLIPYLIAATASMNVKVEATYTLGVSIYMVSAMVCLLNNLCQSPKQCLSSKLIKSKSTKLLQGDQDRQLYQHIMMFMNGALSAAKVNNSPSFFNCQADAKRLKQDWSSIFSYQRTDKSTYQVPSRRRGSM